MHPIKVHVICLLCGVWGRRPREAHRPEYDRLREELIAARARAGLSQRELSKLLGRSPTFASKVERGERHIDLIELVDFAEALNIDAVGLLKLFLPGAGSN